VHLTDYWQGVWRTAPTQRVARAFGFIWDITGSDFISSRYHGLPYRFFSSSFDLIMGTVSFV
jgi:hypothetical protein